MSSEAENGSATLLCRRLSNHKGVPNTESGMNIESGGTVCYRGFYLIFHRFRSASVEWDDSFL